MVSIRHVAAAMLAAALALPLSASAGTFAVGIGDSMYSHKGAPSSATLDLEWHTAPVWKPGSWRIAPFVALSFDKNSDAWGGVGLDAQHDFGRWFIEISEVPGFYHAGSTATKLGGLLEFRTLVGLGYHVTPTTSLMLAAYHRSNANLYAPNPGVNTVTLRVLHQF